MSHTPIGTDTTLVEINKALIGEAQTSIRTSQIPAGPSKIPIETRRFLIGTPEKTHFFENHPIENQPLKVKVIIKTAGFRSIPIGAGRILIREDKTPTGTGKIIIAIDNILIGTNCLP